MELSQLINKIELIYGSWGYLLVFLSSFIETTPMGWAIPGGTIVAIGGFFSYGNNPSFLVGTLIFGALGMLLTFLLAYYAGLKTGLYFIKKFHQEKNAKRAELLLKHHGPTILTTSLLANLTRFWVAYLAGHHRYNFYKFFLFSTIASFTWSSLLVFVGYIAGSGRHQLERGVANIGILTWGILILTIGIIYRKFKKLDVNYK